MEYNWHKWNKTIVSTSKTKRVTSPKKFSVMKKVFILFCLCFCFSAMSFAQEMKVLSFNSLPQDLSARTHPRTDLNGDPCALIKVQIPELNNITFEGWVIDQKYTPGEYLVYIPANTKKNYRKAS